jgi:hypothetical protein
VTESETVLGEESCERGNALFVIGRGAQSPLEIRALHGARIILVVR